jgi:hypothetical protein
MVKSIGIAFILGLIVAGLGHIYIGYIRRGIIFLIIDLVMVIQIIVSTMVDPSSYFLGVLLLFAVYVWSLADLYQLFKKDESLSIKTELACGKCGFRNQLSSEYCIKCGLRLQNSCPNCGQMTNP